MKDKLFFKEWFVLLLIAGVILSLGAVSWMGGQAARARKFDIKAISSTQRLGLIETKTLVSVKGGPSKKKSQDSNSPSSHVRKKLNLDLR